MIFKLEFGADFFFDYKALTLSLPKKVKRQSFFDYLTDFKGIKRFKYDELRTELSKFLPKEKISKFQQFLPEKFQTELLAEYFLDINGALEILGSEIRKRKDDGY